LVLLDLSHRLKLFFVVAGQVFNIMGGRNELNLVYLPNNFAGILCLVIFLANISGFVVKETMRVSHPSDSSEKYSSNQIKQTTTYIVSSLDIFLGGASLAITN